MSSNSKRLMALLALLLTAITALVYARGFDGPFIYDDANAIVRNRHSRLLWPLHDAMTAPRQSTVAGRPVVSLTLAINYQISGLRVWSYHALNLLLHASNALLLMTIVYRTLGRPGIPVRLADARAGLAFVIALLWAVHPLGSETVVYIIQRTELLFALFCLLTLVLFIIGAEARRSWPWYAGAVIACALGALSKEVAYAIPLIVLLYDRAFVGGGFAAALRRRWALYLGLLANWGILVYVIASQPRSLSVGFDLGVGPLEYLYTQAGVILWYLRLCFAPWPLSIHYEWPIVRVFGGAWPAGIVVIGLLVLTLIALARWPRVGFLGACVFLVLAPTSSFVPIVTEIAAERRMYLPLAAVIVLVVTGAYGFMAIKPALKGALAGCAAVLVLVAGLTTAARVEHYNTGLAIWQKVLEQFPDSASAHNAIGNAHYEAGRYEQARDMLERGLRIEPNYIKSIRNLGKTYTKLGEPRRGIELLHRAVELDPKDPDSYASLGDLLSIAGQHAQAEEIINQGLQRDPDHTALLNNLANLYRDSGRIDEAMRMYRRVMALDPGHGIAHANMGVTLAQLGRLDEAGRYFDAAARLDVDEPGFDTAYAAWLLQRGRTDEAGELYQQVLASEPDNTKALANLAVILQRRDRLSDAERMALRLLELEPDHAEARNNLGVIYARQGRVADAADQFARAVELNPDYADAKDNLTRARELLEQGE